MKKSTVKAVLITSAIFAAVTALIVFLMQSEIDKLKNEQKTKVMRIVANQDIEPGMPIIIGTEEEKKNGLEANVEQKRVQDVLNVKDLLYKMLAKEPRDEEGKKTDNQELINDGLWAQGKIATQKIYEGEWLTAEKVATPEEYYDYNERLWAIPFDAETTGGYNIKQGEYVDIMVSYKTNVNPNDLSINPTIREIYKTLQPNQLVDVVFAKRLVEDIRDETGASVKENSATKPGFVCFRLTYDEINKLRWAQECGTIYIGKSRDYSEGPYAETFMNGIELPSIDMQTNIQVGQ